MDQTYIFSLLLIALKLVEKYGSWTGDAVVSVLEIFNGIYITLVLESDPTWPHYGSGLPCAILWH